MAYSSYYPVTTARFANVAFSNGSLPDGWMHRLQKKQPLIAPYDVKRYFVSPEESGQICLLACVLGKSGEVFFPKLCDEQMLTFSAICDAFIEAQGLNKRELNSDNEAKRIAHEMSENETNYPVVYTASNTTGEKAYEEFYIPGEQVNMERFKSLGVVEQTEHRSMDEVVNFFDKMQQIFATQDFTKAEIVSAIKAFLPNFEHEEKGKNLDQKM